MVTNKNLKEISQKVKPSATLVINELSTKLIQKGKEVYKFGFGQSPFPVPSKIVKALQTNAHQKDYLPVKGLDTLRNVVATFFKEHYQLNCSKNEVMIGPGSKELMFDFQMVYQIDELLLPNPSWVSYEPQAHLTQNKTVWLPTTEDSGWKLQAETVENHCKQYPQLNRTIILNYPNNPSGTTYTSQELKTLATVFETYQITVISDEIYGEVHHLGAHQTIAKHYPDKTIISSGLSKWAGAGGWRLGVMVFPKKMEYVLDAMAVIASETYTSTSAPIQYAAIEAYKTNKEIELYLENSRKILKAVGSYVYRQLTAVGVSMPKPNGAFYIFPNFEMCKPRMHQLGIKSSSEFCNQLLQETGVALLPGEAFGRPKEEFTARLSFVDFDGEMLLKLLQRRPDTTLDDNFVAQFCPKIYHGIRALIGWVS